MATAPTTWWCVRDRSPAATATVAISVRAQSRRCFLSPKATERLRQCVACVDVCAKHTSAFAPITIRRWVTRVLSSSKRRCDRTGATRTSGAVCWRAMVQPCAVAQTDERSACCMLTQRRESSEKRQCRISAIGELLCDIDPGIARERFGAASGFRNAERVNDRLLLIRRRLLFLHKAPKIATFSCGHMTAIVG